MKNLKLLSIKKKVLACVLAATMAFGMMTGCGTTSSSGNATVTTSTQETESSETVTEVEMPEITWATEAVVGAELEADSEADATITLSDEGIDIEGDEDGITVESGKITITKAGTYEITGKISDGQIVVDTEDEETVKLVLNGVDITNTSGAAIYVANAGDKVTIHNQKGSVNLLCDGSTYDEEATQNGENATIYSADDLKITGAGALYITANYEKGINTKDDLTIKNASVYVKNVDDGIRGNESVTIESAYVYVEAGGDGIKTAEEEDTTKGDVNISDSQIYLETGLDGISASKDLIIKNVMSAIETAGGHESSSVSDENEKKTETAQKSENGQKSETEQKPENGQKPMEESGSKLEYSAKGLKAEGTITIEEGVFCIDSLDDAIHSNTNVTIESGSLDLSSGDDGIHATDTLTINDGIIEVSESYEGLEGQNIVINDGTIRINASDDGINGSGGTDNSGTESGNGMGAQDPFASTGNAIVEINGGYLYVNASGDGLDSNGSIQMTGGTVIVFGPENDGNGTLDYDKEFTLTGGSLLAAGSSGMAQSVSDTDLGIIQFTCDVGKNVITSIQDEDGNILCSFASTKDFSCVVYVSADIESGKTYTVYTGGSYNTDSTDGIFTDGTYTGGSKLGDVTAD